MFTSAGQLDLNARFSSKILYLYLDLIRFSVEQIIVLQIVPIFLSFLVAEQRLSFSVIKMKNSL